MLTLFSLVIVYLQLFLNVHYITSKQTTLFIFFCDLPILFSLIFLFFSDTISAVKNALDQRLLFLERQQTPVTPMIGL